MAFKIRGLYEFVQDTVFSLVQFDAKSKVSSPNDGDLLLTNAAGDDFNDLFLGGQTVAYAKIRRSGAAIVLLKGDGSSPATLNAGSVISSGSVTAASGGAHSWTGRCIILSPSTTEVQFRNSANSDDADALIKQLVASGGIGEFGATPPASQPAAIADVPTGGSADAAANATAINSILAVLRARGTIDT